MERLGELQASGDDECLTIIKFCTFFEKLRQG